MRVAVTQVQPPTLESEGPLSAVDRILAPLARDIALAYWHSKES
jgi:hypothetical protein